MSLVVRRVPGSCRTASARSSGRRWWYRGTRTLPVDCECREELETQSLVSRGGREGERVVHASWMITARITRASTLAACDTLAMAL